MFIRNFSIIAHIDHGKTTLTDRLLRRTNTITERQFTERLMDSNPIEKERGITIKLAPVRMEWEYQGPETVPGKAIASGKTITPGNAINQAKGTAPTVSTVLPGRYQLNLIDTPGHVDFSYEVSRSLAACEGVLLVVDASQGVQAQTLANYEKAKALGLKIIPVINKIDLPVADPDATALELMELFDFAENEMAFVSAKTGVGIDRLLDQIVELLPGPDNKNMVRGANEQTGRHLIEQSRASQPLIDQPITYQPITYQPITDQPLRALVFTSLYDSHQGVIAYVRVMDGELKRESLTLMAHGRKFTPTEVGFFGPDRQAVASLRAGEVGYIATGLKDVSDVQVGDTITQSVYASKGVVRPLPGYKEPQPMVYLEYYPIDGDDFVLLQDALNKLRLHDAALQFVGTHSPALGNGFRVGFLGILHAEIVQERLRREFNLDLVATSPSVPYQVLTVAAAKSGFNGEAKAEVAEGVAQEAEEAKEEVAANNGSAARVGMHGNDRTDGNYKTRASDGTPFSAHAPASARLLINNASELPDPSLIAQIYEPMTRSTIFTPRAYLGAVMTLCDSHRGKLLAVHDVGTRVRAEFALPLAELIVNFHDELKSVTSGFASLEYEVVDYLPVDAVKLSIIVQHEEIAALSQIVVRDQAEQIGRAVTKRLKEVIPRQQFEIPIQAAIGGRIVARETVSAFRKDVTAKLYGGDRTRRDKLLEKQKRGKKRMKEIGRVSLPQEAFMAVLQR